MKSKAPCGEPHGHLASTKPPSHTTSHEERTLPKRSKTETRAIARALALHPIPEFTKKDISKRWSVCADTVRRLLRDSGIDPGRTRDLSVPITDILAFEGVSDPLETWALCSDEERLVWLADLLTPTEKRDEDSRWSKLHLGTYRRHAREGRLASIQIGKQHRFRLDLASAKYRQEMCRSKKR